MGTTEEKKNGETKVDVNVHTMLWSLMYVADFSKLPNNRRRKVTALALLDYLCKIEKCKPEDLSKNERDLVEKVLGGSIEELKR